MQRNWWKFVLGLGLLGCGGLPNALPVGFDKPGQTLQRELWVVWRAAQESLAQEVELNPLQRSSSGAPADIRPGDPRALDVMPHHLKVSAELDVTALDLLVATGMERSDPTGMIACPLCRRVFVLKPGRYPIRRFMGGAGRQFFLCAGV